jgi:hypothetical protein
LDPHVLFVEILKDADLAVMTAKKVRLQLQEEFKSDLTAMKKEVDAVTLEELDKVLAAKDKKGK